MSSLPSQVTSLAESSPSDEAGWSQIEGAVPNLSTLSPTQQKAHLGNQILFQSNWTKMTSWVFSHNINKDVMSFCCQMFPTHPKP